ncbi:MAG TPA: Crp/Fnr family transcriptional regulator, partial [Acidobacteriota bacterium]|nr:Crp/Fnr family transcriptional regulator [Acidobacteriota bacterium]
IDFPQNQILAGLPENELENLIPHFETISPDLRTVLYEAGGAINYAYFPQEAVISLVAVLTDGKSIEVGLIGSEGILGMDGLCGGKTSPNVAIIQSGGTCLKIKLEILQAEFKRRPLLQQRLLSFSRQLLIQTAQTAACNRVHQLKQRLSRWLLMFHDRVRKDQFLLTHEFLSHMLGAPRSEVTLAAGLLRDQRLIHYSAGKISIVDRNGLESTACECYEVVRRESRPS